MAGDVILAIDQGTTGSTAVVLTTSLDVIGKVNVEFPQIYPQPGWVEHDPDAIWRSVESCVTAALAQAGKSGTDVAAIGITNQRETSVVWDRATGAPIHNAIVWQCRRTTEVCQGLRAEGHADRVKQATGLVLDLSLIHI